jgi:predicted  nucleic acid-binding Zn-ribbon protein
MGWLSLTQRHKRSQTASCCSLLPLIILQAQYQQLEFEASAAHERARAAESAFSGWQEEKAGLEQGAAEAAARASRAEAELAKVGLNTAHACQRSGQLHADMMYVWRTTHGTTGNRLGA